MLMNSTIHPSSLPRPKLRYRKLGYLAVEILETFVLIVVMYSLVNLLTARFVVEGSSMFPTFETGQYIIVSRLNYLLNEPQRGDIVVFHFPNGPQDDYIKRLIGLPGDVVEIRETLVYVNGDQLQENYINEPCSPNMCRDGRWELAENQYFLMGDNRNHSSDSRSFGAVDRQFIVGEAVLRYFPLSEFGIITDIGYTANTPADNLSQP